MRGRCGRARSAEDSRKFAPHALHLLVKLKLAASGEAGGCSTRCALFGIGNGDAGSLGVLEETRARVPYARASR